MIDPSLSAALARVAQRANDIVHGYSAGFEPQSPDVATRTPRLLADSRPLSTSAPDNAYFAVVKDGRMVFTRDGAFRFEDGELRDSSGAAVLGHGAHARSNNLTPLRVDAVDAALRPPRDVFIDADGYVSFIQATVDPRNGTRREERVTLGRLALVRFPSGTSPVQVDDRHVAPPTGVSPHAGTPSDGQFGPLRLHVRELGKVDLEAALRRLQEAYLSLQALQAAYRTRSDLEKGAVDLLK